MIRRCLGLNKYNKRCRKKLNDNQQYYCCKNHQPINLNQNNKIDCFCCCEEVEPNKLWNMKCGHSFHKDCMKQWFNKFSENKETNDYIHEKDFQCPLCRKNIYEPVTKLKKQYKNDNSYISEILKLCKEY
jgi:hypothetical protein